MTTTNTPDRFLTEDPVDERGRLLHAEDLVAQLALVVTRLEKSLADQGRTPADLTDVELLTVDETSLSAALDVVTDRLASSGARPAIRIHPVTALDQPGQLVALTALLTPSHNDTHEGTAMTTTAPITNSAAEAVRQACPERVFLSGEVGYEAGRMPWNLAVDQRPAAVATVHTVEEVQAVVRAAAEHGLRVAPQSSGHGAAPLEGQLAEAVLVRLNEMIGVDIDAEQQVARVTGGTLWHDVIAAAAPHGLTALHGSSPDVAVAGYVLGGGMSFYGRQHGLAANSLVAVEVVAADGELVRADTEENTDLFWAVRGGGGSFGVVVAIELRLFPIAEVVGGMLLWPLDRAPEVTRAWLQWTREVPESVTTSMRLMSFPPLPELPPFLSGRRIVVIDGAVLEDDDRAVEILAPLRALEPEMDTFARMPSAGLLAVHMDPPVPTPAVADHAVLGELDDKAIETLLSKVGPGTTTSLLFAELRQLGGAFGRPAADGGALSHLPGSYSMYCVAVAPVPEAAAAGRADAEATVAAMQPWATPAHVLNFSDTVVDTATAYDADAWTRLCSVRTQVDPAGVFLANHQVR